MRLVRVAALAVLAVIGAAPSCIPNPADVDGNGVVDPADLAIVEGCFGQTAPFGTGCTPADVNADGVVDILDISNVASHLVSPTVPYLGGLSQTEAETALVAAGLQLGGVVERASVAVPVGDVVSQAPDSGTPAPAGSGVDVVLSASLPPEPTTLGTAWEGAWEITVTSSDPTTGSVVATEVAVVELCAGDTLGLALVPTAASCTGDVTDAHLEAHCTAQSIVGGCTVDLAIDWAADRSVDSLVGAGSFSLGVAGLCAGIADPDAEDLQIAGVRTSSQTTTCGAPATALSQHVLFHPSLLAVLEP